MKKLSRSWQVLVVVCALEESIACQHRRQGVLPASISTVASEDFVDLSAGGLIEIVSPILKDPNVPITLNCTTGSAQIDCRANNITGYAEARYLVKAASDHKTNIHFVSGRIFTGANGSIVSEKKLPKTVSLPRSACYARVVYLIRNSSKDHSAALVTARTSAELNATTLLLQRDGSCNSKGAGSTCTWIPLGVAVRYERKP